MLKRAMMILAVLLLATTAVAQDAATDTDDDTVPDTFDGCPNQPGLPELSGCPDGDADGVPDPFDSCPIEVGTLDNFGCPAGVTPDFDKDAIADFDDLCYDQPGTLNYFGCTPETFPDFDHDGIADPFDACFDQPGAADNTGCPAGVVPDSDTDGIPDAQDACSHEYGSLAANGCQPDADQDTIPDDADACPQQGGIGDNYGCPEGSAPPDADGDLTPDIIDGCPAQAGVPEMGGCPDSDGDGVPDNYDACPTEPGDPNLIGCLPVETAALPTNRAPLVAANAASVTQLAQLTVGAPMLSLSPLGKLAVRASEELFTYNILSGQLAPEMRVATGSAGYPVAISPAGDFIATLEFPPDFSKPYIQIHDGLSGSRVRQFDALDPNGGIMSVHHMAFSPVAPLLAVAQSYGGGFMGQPSNMPLWDVSTGAQIGQLPHPDEVINLSFSADGKRLATDSATATSMVLFVWDVAAQSQLVAVETTRILNFMGTPLALNAAGTLVAYGTPDGSLTLLDVASGSPRYTVQVFNRSAGEVVSAVAYSPDGSFIAAAGGVPFSAGLTGNEVFSIALLDAASGQELARLQGHQGLIRELAFSADSTLLVSGGDTTIRFWGVAQ